MLFERRNEGMFTVLNAGASEHRPRSVNYVSVLVFVANYKIYFRKIKLIIIFSLKKRDKRKQRNSERKRDVLIR